MILTENVSVYITSSKNHYISLGYDVKYGDTINVPISDLPKSSNTKLLVRCDFCPTEKYLSLDKYNKNISKHGVYACCTKCSSVKNKLTCMQNYGVESPLQSKSIMDKVKATNQIKYGCDNVFQNDDIKEKSKLTNLKNLGVEYPLQSKLVMDKSNKTNLKKYGFERACKNKLCSNKIIDSYKNKLIAKFNNPNVNILDIRYDERMLTAVCDKGHTFDINIKTLYGRVKYNRVVCTECNPILKFTSQAETEILEYISSFYSGEVISNTRNIIPPLELDIYLPKLKISIEHNGVYWHSDATDITVDYHKNKSDMCKRRGIKIIHVYENEWVDSQDIVKSQIKNLISHESINCDYIVTDIDSDITLDFLLENSLHTYDISDNIIGLYNDGELVSVLSYSVFDDTTNIICLCDKLYTNSDGYLLQKIINITTEKIIYEFNRDLLHDELCLMNNFELVGYTEPNIRSIGQNDSKVYDSGNVIYQFISSKS